MMLLTDVTYGGLMFRYGANSGDTEFMYDCDDCFQAVDVSWGYKFFYGIYYRIYVSILHRFLVLETTNWHVVARKNTTAVFLSFLQISSNGYITFGAGYSWNVPWYRYAFWGPKMVAPYWSDVYLPGDPSGSHIWYRETTEQKDLDKVFQLHVM